MSRRRQVGEKEKKAPTPEEMIPKIMERLDGMEALLETVKKERTEGEKKLNERFESLEHQVNNCTFYVLFL